VAIRKLLVEFPRVLKKIIIAGGITSMDDLQFLWSFDRVVPQLGSAIWKNKITPGEILSEIANYDEHELISAIILSDKKVVKGQVFMSKEAILKTCETGKLYRYSREHKRVMMKGETSGDIQLVQHLAFDCDSDCLLVTVDSGKNFCHNGCFSCFDGCSRK
jgi:phosphoribosyl-AMP cyclohydrolase